MKWEYKFFCLSSEEVSETELNRLGEQGWELVQMTKLANIQFYELVFKRLISDDD